MARLVNDIQLNRVNKCLCVLSSRPVPWPCSPGTYAGCGISSDLFALPAAISAIQAVSGAAAACDGGGVSVTVDLNADHKDRQVAALTADPAEFTSSIVANSTLVALMNDGLARPLDDLVQSIAAALPLVSVDGKIMAVAFMANAQHLFYRKDVLDAAGRCPIYI